MRDAEVRERVERLEGLLEGIESHPPAVTAVQALVELYGEALARLVGGADPEEDELVSHLLLIHGIHPAGVERRVATALARLEPHLGAKGGAVELVAIEDGVARLRFEGSGCASTRATLVKTVEGAVLDAAPELTRVEAEEAGPEPALVQIELPGAGNGRA